MLCGMMCLKVHKKKMCRKVTMSIVSGLDIVHFRAFCATVDAYLRVKVPEYKQLARQERQRSGREKIAMQVFRTGIRPEVMRDLSQATPMVLFGSLPGYFGGLKIDFDCMFEGREEFVHLTIHGYTMLDASVTLFLTQPLGRNGIRWNSWKVDILYVKNNTIPIYGRLEEVEIPGPQVPLRYMKYRQFPKWSPGIVDSAIEQLRAIERLLPGVSLQHYIKVLKYIGGKSTGLRDFRFLKAKIDALNTLPTSLEDPVTMTRVDPKRGYYIKKNVHDHKIQALYHYETLRKLLKNGGGTASSPMTRREFTEADVYRPVSTSFAMHVGTSALAGHALNKLHTKR